MAAGSLGPLERRGTPAGYGAFVDLGYNYNWYTLTSGTAATFFSAYPNAAAYYPNSLPAWPGPGSRPGPGPQFTVAANYLPQTYDTWSLGYEQNGVDEDVNNIIDQGAEGLDDEAPFNTAATASNMAPNGIIDDPPQVSVALPQINPTASTIKAPSVTLLSVGERETLAPYPFPLRGVQITIRVYEPDTRQVREVKVMQDFLPD